MEKNITKQVLKNSFWNFLMVFIRRFGGLVFVIIIARLLLPEKFGIYTIATSIILVILSFTDVAINQTLLRYASDALGKKNKKLAAKYYNYLFKVKLLYFTLPSAIILFILSYHLSFYVFKKPDLFYPLLISILYLIVLSFEHLYETLFYALKKVSIISIKEVIFQISRISLVVLLILFGLKTSSVLLVILIIFILILSSSIVMIFSSLYLRKTAGFFFKKSDSKINKKRVNKFIKHSIVSDAASRISGEVDIFLIGALLISAAYVGYYSAAFAIIAALYSPIAISNILLPVFTQMKKNRLSRAFTKVFRYTVMISLPLIFGLFILGRYFLRLIYSYEYLEATPVLIVLSIMILGTPIIYTLKALLFAKEKTKFVFQTEILATIFNIVLSLILILSLREISMIWAVVGAAIATVISRASVFFRLSRFSKKELNISYDLEILIKSIISAGIMALVLVLINLSVKDMTLIIGFFEVLGGAAVYILCMIFFKGFQKQDYELIKTLKLRFKSFR